MAFGLLQLHFLAVDDVDALAGLLDAAALEVVNHGVLQISLGGADAGLGEVDEELRAAFVAYDVSLVGRNDFACVGIEAQFAVNTGEDVTVLRRCNVEIRALQEVALDGFTGFEAREEADAL